MRRVAIAERRARLGRRHRLAPGHAAADALEAANDLVGLHATDPASIYLSARQRVGGFAVEQLETSLYDERTLVKHLCMRRTLFVLPSSLLPVVQAACSDAVARRARRRLVDDLERCGVATDGSRWLARASRETLAALEQLGEATGQQLARAVPALRTKIVVGEGTRWGGEIGVTTHVLTILSAEGRIERGRPVGGWTSSKHRWRLSRPAASGSPAPDRPPPARLCEADARLELVRHWLGRFGPATEADLAWWTGLGLTKVRESLRRVGAVEVAVDGAIGYLLPDDLDDPGPVDPWVALLPGLDPTTMGWKLRDWYLGEHGALLFDRNGNAGPTVWADGRVVGGWAQRPSGEVAVRLLEDIGAERARAVDAEAERLERWLGDTIVTPRFSVPLERELRS